MIRAYALSALTLISALSILPAHAAPISVSFDSVGVDKKAIEHLLEEYTKAVSTKDQARFEALLLNRSIPFSDAGSAISANGADSGAQNYESFRKGVFGGPPFEQRFQDIKIQQDGPLAEVSLVFVNSTATESTWGWKTMQLLKVDGHWKIASEFFTGHG